MHFTKSDGDRSSVMDKHISSPSEMNSLERDTKYLTFPSSLLKLMTSWPSLYNLTRVTIKHDVTINVKMYLWEDIRDAAKNRAVRSEIINALNREVLAPEANSGFTRFRTIVPNTVDIRLKGRFTATRRIPDPRENITFVNVYEDDYTYDVRTQTLGPITLRSIREEIVNGTS